MKSLLLGGLALILTACAPQDMGVAGSRSAANPASSDCSTIRSPHSGALEALSVAAPSGPVSFQVEIADNDAEREFGLMCRTSIAADRGMLFEFTPPLEVSFWMRNTLIPLDIIYIGADGRILNIAADAQPMDETGLPSAGPAAGVLELAAGRAAQLGLAPGVRVTHPFFTR